jgi:Acetyltransferases, including N-acetylases of ribosomal proteins
MKEHIYLETERTIIRAWSLDDVIPLYKVMSEVEVHTYANDSPWTVEKTENYINFMLEKNFCSLDLFHGAIVLKHDDKIIGRTGLNPFKDKMPEIEWKIDSDYLGKGYATEIGEEIIKQAFLQTDIESIYGFARPNNKASIRVMEKIGMRKLGIQEYKEIEELFFIKERS